MIPYFQYNAVAVGPVTFQVWGILVSAGVVAAVLFSVRLSKKYLLSAPVILDLAVWTILGGLVGARVFYVLFYAPQYYLVHPEDIFKFWQGGASSLGGFLGAAAAAYLFAKLRRFSWTELKPYFDIGVLSLWLGWGIGRLGCFLIHDHPGRLSDFFLAVNFSSGARHDLGLYESLLAFAIFIVFFRLFARLIKIRWGLAAGYSLAVYAVARFGLDFLRATDLPGSDARYWALTPAQWGMTALILILTLIMVWGKIKRPKQTVAN